MSQAPADTVALRPRLQPHAATQRPPARVVILGECNSGKTWLANTLLGASVLPTSFVTRTGLPTVIEFGARQRLALERHDRSRVPASWDQPDDFATYGRRLRVRLPLPRLKGVRLVDTPGLGDGDERGDRRTRSLCRHADIVLWCTSALQAWKASERSLWLSLPAPVRANGILVLTFTDMLRDGQDASRILTRLHAEAGLYFQGIMLPTQLDEMISRMTGSVCGSWQIPRPAQPEPAPLHCQFAPAIVSA